MSAVASPPPSTVARALAVAATRLAGPRAGAALARIAGPDAAAARAEAARLGAAGDAAVAAAADALAAPRPAGVDEVHPSWRAAALAGDDPRVAAIADGRAAAPPAVWAWAARRAFGGLVAMPAAATETVTTPADLPRARPDWLVLRLERIGLRQLAHATASAPAAERAALAAALGVRGRAYVEAVTRIAALAPADAEARLGPRRAAQARCGGLRLADDRLALLAIGARALAPHLAAAGGDVAAQLAQRLPVEPGRRVRAELAAWATQVGAPPSWSEIAS